MKGLSLASLLKVNELDSKPCAKSQVRLLLQRHCGVELKLSVHKSLITQLSFW